MDTDENTYEALVDDTWVGDCGDRVFEVSKLVEETELYREDVLKLLAHGIVPGIDRPGGARVVVAHYYQHKDLSGGVVVSVPVEGLSANTLVAMRDSLLRSYLHGYAKGMASGARKGKAEVQQGLRELLGIEDGVTIEEVREEIGNSVRGECLWSDAHEDIKSPGRSYDA